MKESNFFRFVILNWIRTNCIDANITNLDKIDILKFWQSTISSLHDYCIIWVFVLLGKFSCNMRQVHGIEAGTTFDNSFFDNSFIFLWQFKNRSFLDTVFLHVTGRFRFLSRSQINRTKTGEDLTSINSNFDFLRLG